MYHVPYTIYLCIILVPIYFYDLLSILALHLSLNVCRFPLPRSNSLALFLSLCRFLCFVWFCLLPQRASKIAAENVTKAQNFLTSSSCVRHVNKFSRCSGRGRANSLPRTLAHSLALNVPVSLSPSLSLALRTHIFLLHLAAISQYYLVYIFA